MHPRDSRIYVAPSVRGFELLAGKPAFFESFWGVLTVYDVFVGLVVRNALRVWTHLMHPLGFCAALARLCTVLSLWQMSPVRLTHFQVLLSCL